MSDNYFVDTTSTAIGAGGAVPEGGTADVATLAPDVAAGTDGASDGVAGGEDASAVRDVIEGGAGSPDVVIAPRDAASDRIVVNLADAASATVFSDDFENDVVGMLPFGWSRGGGSAVDWGVVADSSQVLAQSKSPSTTIRFCFPSVSTNRAASVSARIKVTQDGSSGTTTALLCIRYVTADGSYECVALEPGSGVQIKTNQGDGPVWPRSVTLNAWYLVTLAVDDFGMLSASLQGAPIGTFRAPSPIVSGGIAVGTQSAEADFDDVVLTAP
jgi:hypothetical protein